MSAGDRRGPDVCKPDVAPNCSVALCAAADRATIKLYQNVAMPGPETICDILDTPYRPRTDYMTKGQGIGLQFCVVPMENPTMNHLKCALVAGSVLGSLALVPASALAMPNGLTSASAVSSSNVENVAWVCGPYRCWWRPYWRPYWGHYGYAWGPRWGWGGRRWYHWHGGYRWHRW